MSHVHFTVKKRGFFTHKVVPNEELEKVVTVDFKKSLRKSRQGPGQCRSKVRGLPCQVPKILELRNSFQPQGGGGRGSIFPVCFCVDLATQPEKKLFS